MFNIAAIKSKRFGSLVFTVLLATLCLVNCGGGGGGGSAVAGGGGGGGAPGAISGFSDGGATAYLSLFPLAYAAGPYTLVTTETAHGLATGDFVDISGTGGVYDGKYVVASAPTSTTFKIDRPFTSNPGTGAFAAGNPALVPVAGFVDGGGGTITVTAPNTSSLAAGDVVVISGSGAPASGYDGTYTVVSANATTFTITAAYVPGWATNYNTTWQEGGGLIAGCSTTTTGTVGAITLPSMTTVPSRFSGVAPLAVFFDATGTTATATTRPFHELGYGWSFGDNDTVTWSYGAHVGDGSPLTKKNRATGAVAAHVFETPGNYTVTLAVTDGTNVVTNACVQIAVQDPDVVFAGANTVCVSTSGTFTDCPSGADQRTTSDFKTAIAYLTGTKRRLLFRRGEIWDNASQARITATGPGLIGAYGTGAKPLISSSQTDGGTILKFSDSTTTASDWRVMDLELRDATSGASLIGGIGSGGSGAVTNQLTLLRLYIHDIYDGIAINNAEAGTGHDQIMIADSNLGPFYGGFGGTGFYLGGDRLAILGTHVDDTQDTEHPIRVIYASRSVFSSNTASRPRATKNVFRLGGTKFDIVPLYTEKVIISDNDFNNISGQPNIDTLMEISNLNPRYERLRDIIVERNWLRTGADNGTLAIRVGPVHNVSIRNNIVDMTLTTGTVPSGRNFVGISDNNPTVPVAGYEYEANGVDITNNTVYAGDADTSATRVASINGDNGNNIRIVNNLAYFPLASSPQILSSKTTGVTLMSNNTCSSSSTCPEISVSSPGFSGSASPSQFKPTTGYAIGGGTTVPIWSDFFLAAPPTPRDIGAVAH